jgi:transcriptional regulator with XRE-family HTH domain
LFIFEQNFGKMSIGSKVRKYRMYKGLSQRILAKNADMSQSIISSLESDKSIPNSVMLNRIAKELDVDINELLVDENIVQNNSDKAIGNIRSQVTINNHFPENILEILLSNQEKITNLIETQNKLMDSFFKR